MGWRLTCLSMGTGGLDLCKYLTPVASACERAQHVHVLKPAQQLVHGELHGLAHKAVDSQAVLAPVDPRDRAMIPDVMQRGRGDEAVLHQHVRWRLHIEGVPAQALMMSHSLQKEIITAGTGQMA